MVIFGFQTDRERFIWRSCLASAFRTALACSIIGGLTFFGPPWLKHQISFPAFSYVAGILVVTDATLGDTLRGCWNTLHVTILVMCPAFLTLWLMGPARLTASSTAAAVSLSAFMLLVVLHENNHLVSKRIGLGQIVIVYVLAFINSSQTDPLMHPVRVAASTAVGIIACVLPLLLPYPSIACYEVQKNCKLFTKNASERLNLFVKAFCAEDNISAQALILKAKPLAIAATKLLRSIKSKHESIQWERLPVCRFFQPHCKNPGERLQDLETPLRGMEIALSNAPQFPVGILNSELKVDLAIVEEDISRQVKSMPFVSATVPESDSRNVVESLQTLQIQTIPLDQKGLPTLFFLFCLKLLQQKSMATTCKSSKEGSPDSMKKDERLFKRVCRNLCSNINNRRLMPAFKCALSLGLAVFLGSLYSKENGYWAALPIALSLAAAREATFKVSNVKAQGTVLGTIYGVLGSFLFEEYLLIRFLSLLPWLIFCSFLRCSRMYGQAGGISAVIGAVLILGRTNFGPPSEFAIARITETFIGLSCSIVVEIFFQPTRASTLAKIQLSNSLRQLHSSIGSISLCTSKSNSGGSLEKLKLQVTELGKFIGEAEVEPNFWFLPFPSACYGKLLGSLSRKVEFLLFISQSIEILEQESGRINSTMWKDIVNSLESDLEILKDMVGSSIKFFEEITLIKSLAILDQEFERKKNSLDLELGQSSIPHMIKFAGSIEDEKEKDMSSYLHHSKELVDGIHADKGEKELKSLVVLSLCSLAFCMSSLVKETKEIEKAIKELVQWENPSGHVNLHDISCKVHALAATKNPI